MFSELQAVTPSGVENWPINHLGANGLQPGVTPVQGFIVEAMVTFVLVLVVYGCCDSRRDDVKVIGERLQFVIASIKN